MNCTGTTANGGRCLRHATPGFDTCAQHRAQAAHARTILARDILGEVQPVGPVMYATPGEARASRKHAPQLQLVKSIDDTQARELLARMKHDGLITQRRDGTYHLRSYGRDVLTALQTITQEGH